VASWRDLRLPKFGHTKQTVRTLATASAGRAARSLARKEPRADTPEMDRRMGTMADAELAHRLGCSMVQVHARRLRLGISAFNR
jgi:hypothetical protein